MEGCSKYCSFCVVPYTRGEEVSRPFDDVITEIVLLAEQGVKEVNLLGQNVNAYRGITHDGQIADLAFLIQHVAEIENILRIRYTTSHPVEFSDNLIQTYASVPKLVNHLHLPVQSGCDRILGLMKRGHTTLEYKSKIRKLRQIRPDISLSSDFIVGFPGETDTDFETTMNFIAEVGFDLSFSFIYSPRPGTPAASLLDPIPLEVKKQRLQLLQNRILQQTRHISEKMLNTVVPILVEGPAKFEGQIQGRTENNRIVNFDGPLDLVGQLVDVKITESLTNCMRGTLA
jgi:tRNA-2-methylthio-N6-dimethylallyladenosine synthase